MAPKELGEDDDWSDVGSDGDLIDSEGGGEEVLTPPDVATPATNPICDEHKADEVTEAAESSKPTDAETAAAVSATKDPNLEVPREGGAIADEVGGDAAATSAGAGDPLPEAKFYEGDRAVYLPTEVNANAVKVRVISIEHPNYRISLPDGTEKEVHLTNQEKGNLFTVDEYEAMTQENEATKSWNFVPTESFGGSGGGEFDDFPNRWRHIDELSINTGALVDGIRILYSDSSVLELGGEGGGWTSFALAGGEYINEAEIKYGRLVQALTFWTNKGRKLGPCGAGGFFFGMGRVSEVRLKAPPRHMLAGVHGRSGKYMDALGLHWAPVTAAAEKVTQQDLSTQLKKKLLKSTECFGGGGGGPFDDGHHNIRINEINVRTGRKGTVKGITVWYFNGKVASYGRKQHDDDHGEYLSLELGEYINEAHVRYGKYVNGLTFKTTQGRELVCDNGDTETDSTKMAVAKAPEGYMLVGIKGGSGAFIDRIGFHWGPLPSGPPTPYLPRQRTPEPSPWKGASL